MSTIALPVITIAKREIEVARSFKEEAIKPFPTLFDVQGVKEVIDPTSGSKITIPRLQKFDENGIDYVVRDLPSADYIVRNPSTGKVTVIKRLNMEVLLKYWSSKGKREFRQIFVDLLDNFKDVNIELVLEDYYLSIPHPTDNCFWVIWRFDQSKTKIDKLGHARYASAGLMRHNIHPREFDFEMNKLQTMGIRIVKCADAQGVYTHFMELIYGSGELDEEVKTDAKGVFGDLFPYLPDDVIADILQKYLTLHDFIVAVGKSKTIADLKIVSLTPAMLDQITRLIYAR